MEWKYYNNSELQNPYYFQSALGPLRPPLVAESNAGSWLGMNSDAAGPHGIGLLYRHGNVRLTCGLAARVIRKGKDETPDDGAGRAYVFIAGPPNNRFLTPSEKEIFLASVCDPDVLNGLLERLGYSLKELINRVEIAPLSLAQISNNVDC